MAGSPSTDGRRVSSSTGEGDPHQRVEEGSHHQRVKERDPAHHEVGEWGDPSLVEECDLQLQEMVLCSSEMEMKSKISIIIKTGFRPL